MCFRSGLFPAAWKRVEWVWSRLSYRYETMEARRRFIAALAATALATPLRAFAQQTPGKIPRIGVLLFNSPQIDPVAPLIEGLQALGYVDGKTVKIEYRYADGKSERLPALAAELVQLKPDLIFAYGGDVAPHAKQATNSIPIVALVSNDPVQSGLVASVGRPGANVTGITLIYDELAGKVLELLKEAVPEISRVAVLWNPNHADPEFRETQRAAIARGVGLQSLEVQQPEDFRPSVRCRNARTRGGFDHCLDPTVAAAAAKDRRVRRQEQDHHGGQLGRLGKGWTAPHLLSEKCGRDAADRLLCR